VASCWNFSNSVLALLKILFVVPDKFPASLDNFIVFLDDLLVIFASILVLEAQRIAQVRIEGGVGDILGPSWERFGPS
jgi:hypothetical protein